MIEELFVSGGDRLPYRLDYRIRRYPVLTASSKLLPKHTWYSNTTGVYPIVWCRGDESTPKREAVASLGILP